MCKGNTSDKKLRKCIEELRNSTNKTLSETAKANNHDISYYSQVKCTLSEINDPDLVSEFFDLYAKFNPNVVNNIETDDRAITGVERDNNNLIQYYTFEIYRRNNPTLIGKLSRTEMETIYRLYSIYGANLTQKIVSREFPQYTFVEFKRILRAFNIYKSDSEFPLHMLEEKTEKELENLHIKNKENNVLRKLEKNELQDTKKLLEKVYKENQELKLQCEKFKFEVTNEITPVYSEEFVDVNTDLVIYLSDLHIGACLESGSLYENDWNKEELERRLTEVVSKISSFGRLNNLVICLLGDSLDGMDRMTARRDHFMPQNMDNREQVKVFIDQMIKFIGRCYGLANNIKVYAVPGGNHDGDAGYFAHAALQYAVEAKFPDTEFTLFEKFFGLFEQGSHKFLICHGKNI